MLTIFRGLRRNLLRSGRYTDYLKYAIGEIVLIVVGILIALQINVWQVNAEEEEITQEYYLQLLDDLNTDQTYIDATIAEIDSFQFKFQGYFDSFNRQDVTQEEMLKTLYNIPRNSSVISFHNSTAQTLESTGDLKLLPAPIRNLLIQHKKKQDDFSAGAFANGERETEMMQPFAVEFGKRFFNKRMDAQSNIDPGFRTDHNIVDMIIALETALLWKANNVRGGKLLLEELAAENDSLVNLIKAYQN